MKRSIVLFMILASVVFTGCTSKNDDNIANEKNNEVTNEQSNSISEVEKNEDIDSQEESKKQEYLDKYLALETELKTSLEGKYAGTTLDMREAAITECKAWDDLLNEVYGIIQQQLSNEDMDLLRAEEIQWLDLRDSKAEESAKEFEGGTMEPLAYEMSIVTSTKERCYELINNYIK